MSESQVSAPGFDETLERVRSIVEAEVGMVIDAESRITVQGPPVTVFEAASDEGDLILTLRHTERGVTDERIAEVRGALADGWAWIGGEVSATGDDLDVTVSATVARDRLGRHAFLAAVHGLMSVVDSTEPAPTAVADDTRVLERAWVATHMVPTGGLPTWPSPDGRAPSSVRLEARVPLSIAETRGDWARVVGANGWTGWLDRRRLEPVRRTQAAAPSTPSTAAAPSAWSIRPLPLIGLFALGFSGVLPWLRSADGSLSALEVPLAFLWDASAAEPPHLGWLVLALAAAVAALTFSSRAPLLFIPLGLIVVAVPLLFVAQVYRGVTESGGSAGDAFALIGIAPPVAFIAGLVLLASARGSR
jgi:hypothetical protein